MWFITFLQPDLSAATQVWPQRATPWRILKRENAGKSEFELAIHISAIHFFVDMRFARFLISKQRDVRWPQRNQFLTKRWMTKIWNKDGSNPMDARN
jgi:hypothetical protein